MSVRTVAIGRKRRSLLEERFEAAAGVKSPALRRLIGISAVEHVENDDGDTQRIGRSGQACQAVNQQIAMPRPWKRLSTPTIALYAAGMLSGAGRLRANRSGS